MKPSLRLLLAGAATLAAAPAAAGQQQQATLAALTRRADAVVRASVTRSLLVTPAWRRVELRTDAVLKGDAPTTFALTEPAGRCCGRSLFALQAGDERLLFLRRVGPTLHLIGGERGQLPATAALAAHVRALLDAGAGVELGRLLVRQLADADPRVADDAAAALAKLPDLSLTAVERAEVAASLTAAVQRGATSAAPLADVVARQGDGAAVDALLPLLLGARRADQAALLQRALTRCPPPVVAERVALYVGRGRRGDVRAAALLAALPASAAQPAMAALLSRPAHPQVKLTLCAGLLEAGVPAAALTPLVPAVVLKMAIARRAERPRLRNILPPR